MAFAVNCFGIHLGTVKGLEMQYFGYITVKTPAESFSSKKYQRTYKVYVKMYT